MRHTQTQRSTDAYEVSLERAPSQQTAREHNIEELRRLARQVVDTWEDPDLSLEASNVVGQLIPILFRDWFGPRWADHRPGSAAGWRFVDGKVQQAMRLAEATFNILCDVAHSGHRLQVLASNERDRTGTEAEVGELLSVSMLIRIGLPFRYIGAPEGLGGIVTTRRGRQLSVEVETKPASAETTEAAIEDSVKAAARRLPGGRDGIVFLRLKERWDTPRALACAENAVMAQFEQHSSLAGVSMWWDRWRDVSGGIAYGTPGVGFVRSGAGDDIAEAVRPHAVPAVGSWVDLRQIAAEALAASQRAA